MIGRWIFVREAGMTRRGWLALGALGLLALIVLLPLRLVLGMAMPQNVTARSVEGTVWNGRIADLNVGPLPLGTVDAGLEPLPLLIGRAQFAISRDGFSAKGGAHGISQASGSIALPDGLGGLPVTGLSFNRFSVRMDDGGCVQAEGTLGVTLASFGSLMPNGLALSGTARCEKGALVVPMRGPQGMERLALRMTRDGRWQADLTLSGLPQEAADALRAGGFDARPGGIGIGTSGSF